MEAKCGMCEFNGIKPHCHRCKMLMNSGGEINERQPGEIVMPLEELMKKIDESDNVNDFLTLGDFICIDSAAGELKMTVIGLYQDYLPDGSVAKVTFAISNIPGIWRFHEPYKSIVLASLPDVLRDELKPVQRDVDGVISQELVWLLDVDDFEPDRRDNICRNILNDRADRTWVRNRSDRDDRAIVVSKYGMTNNSMTSSRNFVVLGCCV